MAITRIHTNIAALNAARHLGSIGSDLSKSIERLSSGLRINRAGDDPAGLIIANRLTSQVRGLTQAIGSAQDGKNLIAVAEGALEEVGVRLNRMRELAVQAANTGVNDAAARQALQSEIFQSIDEITRIADSTQFSSNKLLNGDFSIKTEIRDGQDDIGVAIDPSPVASTLENGTSFLNIIKLKDGSNKIVAGEAPGSQQVVNMGINNQTDIAVSLGHWTSTITIDGTNAAAATVLSVGFFQGVSLYYGDTLTFQGVLADGETTFTGTLSVGANNITAVETAINTAIVNASKAKYGVTSWSNVPDSYKLTASYVATGENAGRFVLRNTGTYFSEASIDFTVVGTGAGRGGATAVVAESQGVLRGSLGSASILSGSGRVGNSLTAITGSTFDSGSFEITVEDVTGSQQRVSTSTLSFVDANGVILDKGGSLGAVSKAAVLNGSFSGGIYTGGTTLFHNSTITLTGTEVDGSTFSAVYTLDTTITVAGDTNFQDFRFATLSGLIEELNYRTRTYTQLTGTAALTGVTNGDRTRFSQSQFTLTTSNTISLTDDYGIDGSQTTFTLTFNQNKHLFDATASPKSIQDDAELTQDGFAESATLSINGGERVRVQSGDVVTLYGPTTTSDGGRTPQVTLRVGSGLTAGTDVLKTESQEFQGSLNGGAAVTFRNGDQDVTFYDRFNRKLTVDFDAILDVTKAASGSDAGSTVLVSTVNSSLSFQVGAYEGQNIRASLGDLRADNLGYGRGSGRTVQDIDITSLTGAGEALDIIDQALDQVNSTRSLLGATTNRLESTVANLTVTAENLTASESRLRDADIAAESTQFTLNQILMQAGTSVLAQANFQNTNLLSLLGG